MDGNKQNNVIETGVKAYSTYKKVALLASIAGPLLFVLIFLLIVLIIIGAASEIVFGADNEDSNSASEKTCGFIISSSTLSKSEFKEKLEEYSKKNSNFTIFAENADDIYNYAKSKNVNPELVAIRAQVEGNGKTTGQYNYWGLGCTNESQGAGCYSYSTFEEGYTDFINVVSKYESLEAMMTKYAYIGAYWFTLDTEIPESDGGCYYAPHIYPNNMPDRVKNACSNSAPSCTMNGDKSNCTKTTQEDQNAYAQWQVKINMSSARKSIFGLEYDTGPCTSTNLTTLEKYNTGHANLNVLSRTLTAGEQTELNQYLKQEIEKAGRGTGDGVAAAGQSLIYWLEQKGYYLQYYWGGGHGGYGDNNSTFTGANPNWGSTRFGGDEHYPNVRKYFGFDCSGFVSWATRTACKKSFGSLVANDWLKLGKATTLKNAKPGDVIAWSTHIQLIVKNNNDGSVIVAESSGSPTNGLVFTKITGTAYTVVDMSNYYKTCDK